METEKAYSEYECPSCEKGIIHLSSEHKHKWRLNGKDTLIPSSVSLPMCDQCFAIFLDSFDVKRIRNALEENNS